MLQQSSIFVDNVSEKIKNAYNRVMAKMKEKEVSIKRNNECLIALKNYKEVLLEAGRE